MVPHTESVASRKRTNPSNTLFLLLLAFLAACALLWFGLQIKPTDRASRISKIASLTTESTTVDC